jgi:hypothetical protein
VARAKRTARAEARRRHRAQTASDIGETGEPLEDDADAAATDTRAPARRAPRRAAAPGNGLGGPERPAPAGGIRNAFRLAFRPLNVREDIALLPKLITHRAFWLPVLLAVINAAALIAFDGRELISRFAMTYFLLPPPIGAIFLAGFLAPRASYLIGLLVGLIASVLFAIVVAAVPTLFENATFTQALFTGLATSPAAGILFASAAAWYRRFLYLASPARQLDSRRPGGQRGKPARGR